MYIYLYIFLASAHRFASYFRFRIKHVSFARSHTLTSFDEATVVHSVSRMNSAKSQERLIGGKKPSITSHSHNHQHHQTQQQPVYPTSILPLAVATIPQQQQQQIQQHQHQHHQHHQSHQAHSTHQPLSAASSQEVVLLEKLKRGAMKTQATQTEGCLAARKQALEGSQLSLSPRTVHRVSCFYLYTFFEELFKGSYLGIIMCQCRFHSFLFCENIFQMEITSSQNT